MIYYGTIAAALALGAWGVAGFWTPWADRFALLAVVVVGSAYALLNGLV